MQRELDPERRRKIYIFIALAYLALIPIGLQLYFDYEHWTAAQIAMGAVTIIYFVALYAWRRRNGLTIAQIRRSRRQGGPSADYGDG